ncbi:PP2C family serine/threonine-protein phosphatase [Flavobacterium sp. H122]|uniref:PP2C family serine/threonine-protein phosphatase n=1 Tax=Flavobacterium sp. H122 TaxID=2529860 RepID=UPI0020C01258|nr:PP2C family serine/threonine-protein phosphatase [Flavobacterium sp. H122]
MLTERKDKMEETRKYVEAFLMQHKISISPEKRTLLDGFIADKNTVDAVKTIKENQKNMLDKWIIKNRIDDIERQSVFLPNAIVGKKYEAKIDFSELEWQDIVFFELLNLENSGLDYDSEKSIIKGIPRTSGDLKLRFLFRLEGEPDNAALHEKMLQLIINPDPKSLWKDIPSDRNDLYWKDENVAVSDRFLDKRIVISSKRGRSHANVGSFRDDDFAYKNFETSGWSVLAVSDGAGGYPVTRKGSQLACEAVVDYFDKNFTPDFLADFDKTISEYNYKKDKTTLEKINTFVFTNLSKAAKYANESIASFAVKENRSISDFHSTLIFTLVKKYSFGYAVMTFSVGDCPIGLVNKDFSEVRLMNWLDVGEFGGGTRFVTMPEIFAHDNYASRFGFTLTDDFSYLMLMTDGIYDPKFVVEANLESIEKWKDLVEDMKGKNEEGICVDFSYENEKIAAQLSNWMDFWSPGNHDDRTLAIIY